MKIFVANQNGFGETDFINVRNTGGIKRSLAVFVFKKSEINAFGFQVLLYASCNTHKSVSNVRTRYEWVRDICSPLIEVYVSFRSEERRVGKGRRCGEWGQHERGRKSWEEAV